MKKTYIVVVFLMVFSIGLQNTCPSGLAGRTAFVAHYIHHCPLKTTRGDADRKDHQRRGFLQHTGQTFTFTVSLKASHIIEPLKNDRLVIHNKSFYQSAFSDPPLKPPRLNPFTTEV